MKRGEGRDGVLLVKGIEYVDCAEADGGAARAAVVPVVGGVGYVEVVCVLGGVAVAVAD